MTLYKNIKRIPKTNQTPNINLHLYGAGFFRPENSKLLDREVDDVLKLVDSAIGVCAFVMI